MRLMRNALLVLVVLPFTGCHASQEEGEKLLQEMLDIFKELGSTLEGIKDEASSKAANAKIQGVQTRLKDLKARDKKVSTSTRDALMKKFEKPLHDAGFKVGMELARVQNIPGTQAEVALVNQILQELQKQ
jgi:uncharacterized lipoprotein YehR (DUF1307 family)